MDSILLSIYCTSLPFNSSLLGVQSRCKTGVIIELSDSLKDVKIVKNNRKRLYNTGVQAIQ